MGVNGRSVAVQEDKAVGLRGESHRLHVAPARAGRCRELADSRGNCLVERTRQETRPPTCAVVRPHRRGKPVAFAQSAGTIEQRELEIGRAQVYRQDLSPCLSNPHFLGCSCAVPATTQDVRGLVDHTAFLAFSGARASRGVHRPCSIPLPHRLLGGRVSLQFAVCQADDVTVRDAGPLPGARTRQTPRRASGERQGPIPRANLRAALARRRSPPVARRQPARASSQRLLGAEPVTFRVRTACRSAPERRSACQPLDCLIQLLPSLVGRRLKRAHRQLDSLAGTI